MPPILSELILPLLVALLASGGFASLLNLKNSKQQREQAQNAASIELRKSELALGQLAQELSEKAMEQARTRLDEMATEMRAQDERHAKEIDKVRSELVHELALVHLWIQNGSKPPPPVWPSSIPRPQQGHP